MADQPDAAPTPGPQDQNQTPPPAGQTPPAQPVQPQPYAAPGGAAITQDEKTWGMLAHLAAFAGYLVPFGNIIGPLVIWLIQKDKMPFVNDQGKEAVNFQITILILAVISAILILIFIGILLLIAVGIFNIVMIIVSALKANRGEYARYPLCFRFIK